MRCPEAAESLDEREEPLPTIEIANDMRHHGDESNGLLYLLNAQMPNSPILALFNGMLSYRDHTVQIRGVCAQPWKLSIPGSFQIGPEIYCSES